MIPVLYAGNETNFTSNGLGRLADAISCKVTEERNGIFELEMQYPITGVHYDEIQENCIIYARTEDGGNAQAFIIYRITRPINGIITIDAQHISYLLNGIPVMPFTGSSLADTMSKIASNAVISCPFNFYTDISSSVSFTFDVARSIRSLLGGEEGSILDVYGGYDYKFDNFNVRLLADRGSDNGVSLRYGKNLTELKNITNMTNVYTGIVPYWQSEQETLYLTNRVVLSGHENDYPYKIIKVVDFSSDFEEKPTEAQLLQKAQSYLSNNKGWKLRNNITVSFVNLSETEDYKDIAPLERVKLCDTVNVIYSRLGVNIKTRVIKTVYNVLLERYDSIELGESTTDLTKALSETLIEQSNLPDKSFMRAAIENATKLIQGGLGGHVVFNTNADGEPQEILIMDTDNISTAQSVIRMNKNGIGFSLTGYNGPFTTAWTINGAFVADFITAGTLNAARIKAGILADEANKNHWNLESGEFALAATTTVGGSTVQTIASNAANGAVNNYDTRLNQKAVFDKLTNNGETQGIYLTDGELYINGTYIKSGTIDAQYIRAGKIEDKNQCNYWDLDTGEFKLSATTQVGNSTIASDSDVSSAVDTLDDSLDQEEVFKRLTNDEQNQGIYLEGTRLYINGEYIKANTISANMLTVDAQETLQEKHSYIEDAYADISKWHNDNGTVPFSYETIDGVQYLVMDCTGISSTGGWGDVVYTPIELIGSAKMTAHFVYFIDRQVTVSTTQRFPCIRYQKTGDSSYWYNSKSISPQTIPANTEFEWNSVLNPTNANPEGDNAFGFYPIQGAKVYIKEISVISTVDVYSSAGIIYNADGLTSTVKKDGVISSINQTAEQVKIQAAKLDLTGSLSLHGTFTTDVSADPAYTGYTAKLDAATLRYFDANNREILRVGPYNNNGLKYGIFLFDSQGTFDAFTEEYLNCKRLNTEDDVTFSSVNGNELFKCSIEAKFYDHTTFESYVYFNNNVYDNGGSVVIVSDKRKKRSIKDLVIEKAKSFIMGLKPRKFKFSKDLSTSNRYHHGFIAQEVKEAMGEDWGVYVENKEKDFIGLRYDELIADMIAVIQDQQKRIEALERRVNDITNNKS